MTFRRRDNETDEQWQARNVRSMDRRIAAGRGWTGARAMRALDALEDERRIDLHTAIPADDVAARAARAWRLAAIGVREQLWWELVHVRTAHRDDLPETRLYWMAALGAAAEARSNRREWASIARDCERLARVEQDRAVDIGPDVIAGVAA